MTDFAAVLSLGADSTGLLQGKAALDSIVGAGRRAEAAAEGVTKATARMSDTASRSATAMQRQVDAVTGLARASDSARAAAQEYANRLNAQAAAFDSLRASIDPVFAASRRYEQAQEQVNAAVRAGIVSQGEANRVMDLARQRYLALDAAADGAAAAQARAAGGTNRLAQAATNASFQVQDFAVQVAAGTSATTALAQQLPQLLGAFGLVGRIALIGSLAGTVVAVAAAVIPMLRRTADEALTAEKAVDALGESINRYAEYARIASSSTSELAQRYGRFAEDVRRLNEFQKELALQSARDTLSALQGAQSLTGVVREINNLFLAQEEARQNASELDGSLSRLPAVLAGLDAEMAKVAGNIGLSASQAIVLDSMFQRLKGAATMEEIAAAAAQVASYFRTLAATGVELTPELRAAARAVGDIMNQAAEATSAASGLPAAFSAATGAAAGLAGQLAVAAGYAASIRAAIANMDFTNIGLAAENAALAAGQTQLAANAAGRLAEERAKLAPLLGSEDAILRGIARRELDRLEAALNTNVALRTANAELVKAAAAAGAAGGGAAKITDEMKAAEEAARELAKELDRIAEERLRRVSDAATEMTDHMLDGFKDGMKGIEDIFLSSLKSMIATAARNQIVVQLGTSGGFSPAQIEAARASQGGGGVLGGIGGLLGGASAGFSGVISGLLSGGLKGAFGAIGTAVGGALSGGLAGIGTALGAIAAPIALIAGLIPQSRITGQGVSGTLGGARNAVSNYTDRQTSMLFGLINWSSTSSSPADPRLAAGLQQATDAVDREVRRAAGALAIGADAVGSFTKAIRVSLSGLSEEQAFAALQGAVGEYADGLAAAVLATDDYVRAGEGQMDALRRLADSLLTVNRVMDNLGHGFRAIGLAGAEVASKLADTFGGLDAFAAATGRFFDLFYAEEERRAAVTRQVTAELARLNVAMPASRDQYRALVASLDVTTEAGRQAYAALIAMADAFDFILPAASALSRIAAEMQGIVGDQITGLIGEVAEAQRANLEAARAWYRTADTLRGFIDDMLGRPGALVSGAQAQAFNQRRFSSTLQAAIGGDNAAARSLPDVARALLDSTRLMAASRVDLARAEARVLSDLGLAAGVSDIEGARHDVIAGLQQEQVDLLTEVRDFLAGGGSLDAARIDALNAELNGLERAIKAAEMINYAFLQERLRVTVDLLATANVPPDVRALLANAAEGIRAQVDFIARTRGLPPDLKFLALTGASEHVKTVQFLARNDMGRDLARVALRTVDTLMRTVRLVGASDMPRDLKRLALAGSSELARTVNVSLASGADRRAIRLALGNIEGYDVAIRAALDPRTSDRVRRIVFGEAGTYTAMIRAAISSRDLSPRARRILLQQQGDYIASIRGVLADDIGEAERRLLLRQNTAAARAVTISRVFAGGMTAEERRLLLQDSTAALRTIAARVDLSGLSGRQLALLDAIRGGADGKLTLGGTFVFDPSGSFRAWYEGSTRAALTVPMSGLRTALEDLTAQLRADAAARLRASRQAEAERIFGGLTKNASGAAFVTDPQLLSLAMALGIRTDGKTPAQIRSAVVNWSPTDAIAGLIRDPTGARRQRYLDSMAPRPEPADGAAEKEALVSRIMASRGPDANPNFIGYLRSFSLADLRAMYPGFAAGGMHGGGFRIVGERGPEIEATGPARYFSASQTAAMLSGEDATRELRALREEVRLLREEQRQLGLTTATSTKRTADLMRRWNDEGLPEERA